MIFKPNPNLGKELERQVGYVQGLEDATEPAAEAARTLAPIEEGDYKLGIKVQVLTGKVFLSATDYKSHWIEWGTVDTPVFAPLRRGIRAAGLRLRETRK